MAQDVPEPSEEVTIQQVVTDGFVHPGIGLTKDMLENARAQIMAKRDPWYSGYLHMAAHPNSAESISIRNRSSKDPSRPASDTFDSRGMVGILMGDADKALRQSLMYYFTGKEIYRANAMEILRIWSKMDPNKFHSFSEDHIHACYPVQNLIRAAELMRYTSSPRDELSWKDGDTRAFTTNFVKPALENFFSKNGYFMNQAGYPMAVTIAGDIFTNNQEDYQKRVEWFTVNKDAPNKGWSFSIQDLARMVDTDALTGKKVAQPQVQLMEMGRDQAHAGDDTEIFTNIARMMNAQGTKVDPVAGTVSTEANAVGPYEFLNDRILTAVDYFCRFMLGYDTPWIPVPYNINSDGTVRGIYPRIADNYRGRIRELDIWDLYYYYTYVKGVDVASKAPYYYEAFTKRIVSSDFDWIFIPKQVSGEGARVPVTEQEPNVVEIEQRFAALDHNVSVIREDNAAFVRVKATPDGTRIAILSCQTHSKTLGMRIRTTGISEIEMSRFKKPWLLPDTKGEWRQVLYKMDSLESFADIVYFKVKASADTQVDIDQLMRSLDNDQSAPHFTIGNGDLHVVTCVGIPFQLDLSAGENVVIQGTKAPADSTLDSQTGAFQWAPKQVGEYEFVVAATAGDFATPKKIHINVVADRSSAIQAIVAGYNEKVPYVSVGLQEFQKVYHQALDMMQQASNQEFFAKLMELQAAVENLEPLTPLLPDGSMDFPKLVVPSKADPVIANLTDGNSDTFSTYNEKEHIYDFGEQFQISATAFAVQGRLNFEDRIQGVVFFGSNDGRSWTPLTPAITTLPTELTRVEVSEDQRDTKFRYLKIQKDGGFMELSEMRIYGQRYEAP